MSEREFTAMVIELARTLGWLCAHFRPAMTTKGWRTPVQGDGAGFVDLVLVKGGCAGTHEGKVLFVELKSESGKLTPEQERWIQTLRDAGQTVYVWRPMDWDRIVEILRQCGPLEPPGEE